jgi:hypothetical protein
MWKEAHVIFVLIIKILGVNWQPKHITIRIFETTHIIWHALVTSLINLLNKHGIRKKILVYVKVDRFNRNAMTNALKSIMSCETLSLEENFEGIFGPYSFLFCKCLLAK